MILAPTSTFLVEFFIVWFFLRKQMNVKKIMGYVFLINLFTWPLANFIYSANVYLNMYENFWLMELGVILAESYLMMALMEIMYKKALLISFSANSITALIGASSSLFYIY